MSHHSYYEFHYDSNASVCLKEHINMSHLPGLANSSHFLRPPG